MNIPYEVEFIINELEKNNFQAYIVGGCVRDYILGLEPKDWDITTSALPQEIKQIFNHTVDTGIKHGTITVILNHKNFEVTTYRIDGDYKDSRHPEQVTFTKNIDEDLSRRDFTMNAIAYNKNNGFVDTFNGIEDIKNKIIRGVGDADLRFKEDALRIMRAVRFSAQLNFTIENNTLKAIIQNAELLKNISIERIRDEFTKFILSDYLQNIDIIEQANLLKYFLPEVIKTLEEKKNYIINSLLKLPKDVIIRFALLLSDYSDKEASQILKRLKFDNSTIKQVSKIIKYNKENLSPNKYNLRKLISLTDVDTLEKIIIIQKATAKTLVDKKAFHLIEEAENNFKQIIKDKDCCTLKQLAINGNDLKKEFKLGGVEIGNLLYNALEEVLTEPSKNQRNYLMEVIRCKL